VREKIWGFGVGIHVNVFKSFLILLFSNFDVRDDGGENRAAFAAVVRTGLFLVVNLSYSIF
jgi:hypothetical protein